MSIHDKNLHSGNLKDCQPCPHPYDVETAVSAVHRCLDIGQTVDVLQWAVRSATDNSPSESEPGQLTQGAWPGRRPWFRCSTSRSSHSFPSVVSSQSGGLPKPPCLRTDTGRAPDPQPYRQPHARSGAQAACNDHRIVRRPGASLCRVSRRPHPAPGGPQTSSFRRTTVAQLHPGGCGQAVKRP